MSTIKREEFITEQTLRKFIRQRISNKLESRQLAEGRLRKVIRSLIQEAETGTEEPSTYTGINVLADLLKNIIPTLEDDYKMLTTSEEQRESFRKHIIHAVQNTLRPIEVFKDAEAQKENITYEFDSSLLKEEIEINIDDEDEEGEAVKGEFIDIEDEEVVGDEEFVKIADQNETGRNFAATSFKSVEKQIVDAYDMLADEEDQNLFYDYLLTNLLLYFDKFEDELSNELPDVSTPEYEEADISDATPTPEQDLENEEEMDLDLTL